MKICFTTYATGLNPTSLPATWVRDNREVADDYVAQAGETVMTREAFAQYLIDNRPAYDAWLNTMNCPEFAARETAFRASTKTPLNQMSENAVFLRALVKVLIDEINTLRTELNKAKANLNSWRAEPALPMRTLAQAKTAIGNAVDDKSAD